jgi:glycogen(starch) synthase
MPVLEMADHVIATSPFLERIGQARYVDKFAVLPIGVDLETFFPHDRRQSSVAPIIVCAGRVAAHKRPEMFLTLAENFPGARFHWFGEGGRCEALIAVAAEKHLINVEFPGVRSPQALADEFRNADIFVLPSYSEGVPKVTQEAAACGLPVVLYGYYESPSVAHGLNGFVAWSDEDFLKRTGQLIADPERRRAMGRRGVEMMKTLHWDVVAPLWEARIEEWVSSAC